MSVDLWIVAGVAAIWMASGPVMRLATGRSERSRRRRNYGRVATKTARPSIRFSVRTGRA